MTLFRLLLGVHLLGRVVAVRLVFGGTLLAGFGGALNNGDTAGVFC